MRPEHWLYTIPLRLRSLFRWAQADQELDDELRDHLERRTEEYVAKGVAPEEARRRARLDLGGVEKVKEECRDARRVNWIQDFVQDLHFGLRMLRKSSGFTVVAVLTLALGIGANTAIFSVVDAVLLRPLPYKDASRLVWATERFPFTHGGSGVISPDFIGWQDHNQVFEQIGASGSAGGMILTGAGQAARVSITNVTTSFFPMLGVRPAVGRTFLESEGRQGQNHVALLSETLWRSRLGAHPDIVGKTIRLDDEAYTVVGVMPLTLRYPSADVWTPFALDEQRFSPHSPNWAILTVVGRLKPGTGIGQAQSDLQLITEQMDREYPPQAAPFRAGKRVEVIPLHELLVQNVRSLLLILLGATGFVLLIACSNVANLLLSRGVVRGREMAVRAAIGAMRSRLIRQLLVEALLLAATGGVVGFLAGVWATKIVAQLIPPNFPSEIHLDARVFGFTAAIAALAVLAFGLVPALISSRTDVSEALKEASLRAASSHGAHRLRSLVSAGEMALSLILLVGAGLLMRSFLRLTEVELGFDPHGLLLAIVERPRAVAFDSQQHAAFFRAALERMQNLPGVQGAALTTQYPFGPPHNATLILNIQGTGSRHPSEAIRVTAISPDYFRVMRTRLLKGRTFGDKDAAGSQPVVIMNDRLVRMAFGDRDPLGRHISFGPPPPTWMEVVGVVADMRDGALEQEPGPEIFVPYLQQPSFSMALVVQSDSVPQSLAGEVREAVESVDKSQPVSSILTMDEIIAGSVAPRRFKMLLVGLLALLALVLAGVGVYGVTAYSCSNRTHEFGVRIALGASRDEILKLVVKQGLRLASIGVCVGVAGALGLTRLMAGLLYGVKPTDPATFVAVCGVLTGVGFLASYIPARRAMRVDPMVALRYE